MGLFNKKSIVYSPVNGAVKSIEKVNDEMFSTKALGDGFAVEPFDGTIVAPIEGTVMSIFPTKHAISLKTKQGLEVLVHIGIDTVELNGSGFTIKVEEGEKVTAETVLAEVDFNFLESKGKDTDVMVIFTNLDKKVLELEEGQSSSGKEIGMIK
ncbi:PTS sugar transporter subunit IIA [Enterococcus raffinosus]|uniref:PTS glucose transporter subunit IIA n=1 Tax=Enterococcus raffinosus TaxID=71452 RepID=A0AAW8T9R2_9ENTE|nr:PTS glucose transporter subunit IIA [Enterococcus raffinosus]MDT2523118.1 PTS glucose transporter subunit IIA [Enterococcus raffinosus]MDT2530250.1 PTS glucose transporter subunit IIA [Enterococcus raffinosus]MDT2534062.1 PTS glucose transporter subunit IIA [Enterococcus raffinosus]MDT2544595.1 PTS glucose transporter subunit IIA [Enterococcus raffinosus]MDT2554089.1 PTS glucose transporter subunit IIA [Enterococcus raffinosus]